MDMTPTVENFMRFVQYAAEPFTLRISTPNRRLCQLLHIAEHGGILPALYRSQDWLGTMLGQLAASRMLGCKNPNPELCSAAVAALESLYPEHAHWIRQSELRTLKLNLLEGERRIMENSVPSLQTPHKGKKIAV